jgi:SAM-dependent methyltransferase
MGLLTVAPARHAELMDDPALPEADHLHALRALATINAFSRTSAVIAAAATRLAVDSRRPIEIVDLACGGGEVTRGCATRLGRLMPSTRIAMTGLDMNDRALARARREAAGGGCTGDVRISFSRRDLVTDGCPPCDLAISSLFLHHLDDRQAGQLLRSMAASCRLGFVISDLIRSRLGLVLAIVGTGVLSTSRVARVDGPLSVRAARTLPEYRDLLDAHGLRSATIQRSWPERVLITWRRRDEG